MEVSGKKQVDSDLTRTIIFCDPCKDERQNAEYFCTDCNEYLCSDCARAHRKATLLKNHNLLGYDEMPKERISHGLERYCKKHMDKPLDYFCTVHNSFFCTVCITLEHRDCNVQYIDEFVQRFNENGEYEKLCQKMKKLCTLIDDTKSQTVQNVAISQQASNEIVEIIKQFRTEINSLLDSLETKIIEKARKIKDEDVKRMSELSSQLGAMKTELDETRTNMEHLLTNKQNKQLVMTSKLAETRIACLEKNMAELCKINTVRKYKFYTNKSLYQTLKSTKQLGSLKKEENGDRLVKKKTPKEEGFVEQGRQNRNRSKFTHQTDINIRHSDDQRGCFITGSVWMSNNRLAVVDCSNKRVCVVDILQGKTVLHIRLDQYPWDITYIDQNQLVVTAELFLVFLNVGKDLTVNKKLEVDGDCLGINYNDNMLIVSFIDPGLVKFMNMDGQVMKLISTDLNGKRLFVCPDYVVTSRDKKVVYVTDWDQHIVTKLDMNGAVIDVYSRKDLRRPRGVTVDKYDNVYMAGLWSNNICVLAVGRGHIQPILKVNSPQSVCVCDDSGLMCVGYESSDAISIYKIHRSDVK